MTDTPERAGSTELPPSDGSPQAELLRASLVEGTPPLERRVFVNRSLRMETIRFIGFDLDWTLAAYNRAPLDQLTFELTLDRLVENHAYPASIRRVVEFRPELFSRGLMIDRTAGTVIRMNRHRYVGAAFLGRDRLDREELVRLYRHEPLHPAHDRFYHVDSLFELPEVNLYAELVAAFQRGDVPPRPYHELFVDVRTALDWVHAEGTLKRRILDEPDRFLDKDPQVALALERLALGGRRLILLTNSDWNYADGLCRHLFEGVLPGLDDWRDLFDLVVVSARKPGFFKKHHPFVPMGRHGEPGPPVVSPSWGGAYAGGNLEGLMGLLDVPGEQVLYVGDHIYGDIVRSKIESTWRTALIVQELEDEIRTRNRLAPELEDLRQAKIEVTRLGHEMDRLRDAMALADRLARQGEALEAETLSEIRRRFQARADQHRAVRRRLASLNDTVQAAFNPLWGSLFKQGSSKTLFASQLESFACLYTSRVGNFAGYGTNHYFRVFEDPMMHEADEAPASDRAVP